MANLLLPPDWRRLKNSEITPESDYWDRRAFLKSLGVAGLGIAGALGSTQLACADSDPPPPSSAKNWTESELYPARRAERFQEAGRPITEESIAASYNNFYEFTTDKSRVKDLIGNFRTQPWEIKVGGLCENPGVWDLDGIEALGLEERVYRFRCVEAWAMTVPWTGVPLKSLIEKAKPTEKAKFVKFTSFYKPKEAPGQKRDRHYPWPYYEALRIDEAMNELTLLATGIYGHRMPKQHGAPVRIVTPWKYGYKSPKSIVSIEFVAKRPGTFWNDLQPKEYSFLSNVEPEVPHPRWSQSSERLIGSGDRVPTLLYNGYGDYVAKMYA